MKKTNKLKSKIAVLAYYQVAGGTIGILLLIWIVVSTFPVPGMNILLYLFMAILFSFAYEYVAGIALSPGINLEEGANFTFNFYLSKLELYINSSKDFAKVEFNLVAMYLVYFIIKLQNAISDEKRFGGLEEDNV